MTSILLYDEIVCSEWLIIGLLELMEIGGIVKKQYREKEFEKVTAYNEGDISVICKQPKDIN